MTPPILLPRPLEWTCTASASGLWTCTAMPGYNISRVCNSTIVPVKAWVTQCQNLKLGGFQISNDNLRFFFETCFPRSSDFSMWAGAQGRCYSSRSNPCPSVGVRETWLVLNLLHEHKTLAGLWQFWADHTQLQCIYSSHGMGTVCVTGGGLTQPAMTFRVQQALLTHQSFICNTVQFCMAIERFKMVTSSMLI